MVNRGRFPKWPTLHQNYENFVLNNEENILKNIFEASTIQIWSYCMTKIPKLICWDYFGQIQVNQDGEKTKWSPN